MSAEQIGEESSCEEVVILLWEPVDGIGGTAGIPGGPIVLDVAFGETGISTNSLAAGYPTTFMGSAISKGIKVAQFLSIDAAGLGTARDVIAGETEAATRSATAGAGDDTSSSLFRKYQTKSAPVSYKRRSLSWRKKQTDNMKSLLSFRVVPVILEKHEEEDKLSVLQETMFAVGQGTSVTYFCNTVASFLQVSRPDNFLLSETDQRLSMATTMAELYANNAHEDGFLYVTYQP